MRGMHFVTVHGRSHCVAASGRRDRRAVVFLNALGTDHRIWDDVLPQLSGLRTVRYDMPGHGLSEADATISIRRLAADVTGLMDALKMRRAVLCGVSVGGLVAQQVAVMNPERVSGLVLCDTGFRIGSPASWTERLGVIESIGLAAAATRIVERWFTPAFRLQCGATVTGYASMLARTDPGSYVAMACGLRDTDLETEVRQLRCRTLVLCGADDVATPPATARALADAIPGARFELIANAAHLPSIEQPAIVAGHIRAFTRAEASPGRRRPPAPPDSVAGDPPSEGRRTRQFKS